MYILKRNSLFRKISFSFFSVAMIILILLGGLGLYTAISNMRTVFIEQSQRYLSIRQSEISHLIKESFMLTEVMANAYLGRQMQDSHYTEEDKLDLLEENLRAIMKFETRYESVTVEDAQGAELLRVYRQGDNVLARRSGTQERASDIGLDREVGSVDPNRCVYLGQTVRSCTPFNFIADITDAEGTVSGRVRIDINLDKVFEEYAVQDTMLAIVDNQGRYVFHPEAGTDSALLDQLNSQGGFWSSVGAPRRSFSEKEGYFSVSGDLVIYEKVATDSFLKYQQSLYLVMYVPKWDLLASMLNYFAVFAVVLIVAIVASGYGARRLATQLVSPIDDLENSFKRLAAGETGVTVEVQTGDELERLGENFNRMTRRLDYLNNRLSEQFLQTVQAVIVGLEERDSYTYGHSARVALFSMSIGKELGLSATELDRLQLGALLHDIGKIGVPDDILNKNGSLTPDEMSKMMSHPLIGMRILQKVEALRTVIEAMEHHERYDGTGYPWGKKGQEISLMGRILAVADAFDAMTSDRPYRKALGKEAALVELQRVSGKQVDPIVLGGLLRADQKGIIDTILELSPEEAVNSVFTKKLDSHFYVDKKMQ